MKRWWLVIALLLSLGVNAGILATLVAVRRSAPPPPPAVAEAPAAPVESTESPGGGGSAAGAPTRIEPPAVGRKPEALSEPSDAGAETRGTTGVQPGEPEPRSPRVEPPAAAPPKPAEPSPRETAPPGGEGVPPGLEPRLGRLADELGLSGERRVRFVALQRRMIVAVVAAERRRRLLEAELRRQLVAPVPDEPRIGELIRRQAEVLVEMETTTARTILESRRLLDPEQERRYLAVIARLRPRLREQAMRRWQQERPGAESRPQRPFRRPR